MSEPRQDSSDLSQPDPQALFGPQYYATQCGPVPYERTEVWLRSFASIADHITRSLNPRKVLDAGCAMGFLVEALWDRGVEAHGIDISRYAISNVRPDMRPYCRVASITDPIEERYDLITCIEVLEHLPRESARPVLENLCRSADAVLFSSTPTDFAEPTHFNVQPPLYWLSLFAECGFWPDVRFDAGFVLPHAFLVRRGRASGEADELSLYADYVRQRAALAEARNRLTDLQHTLSRDKTYASQIFWKTPGSGYGEEQSASAAAVREEAARRLEFRIPPLGQAPDGLRFDIADASGIVRLHRVLLRGREGSVCWDWRFTAGYFQSTAARGIAPLPIGRGGESLLLLLSGPDPQVELPLTPEAKEACRDGAVLEVELSWPDASGYVRDWLELWERAQGRDQRLEQIEEALAQIAAGQHRRFGELEESLDRVAAGQERHADRLNRSLSLHADLLARIADSRDRLETERLALQAERERIREELTAARLRTARQAEELERLGNELEQQRARHEREMQVLELRHQLDTERERAEIFGSWSWRMAAWLRGLAHPFSAAARALRMFRSVRHRVVLEPVRHIETLAGGRYRSTGNDPQFLLRSRRGAWPGGWIVLVCSGRSAESLQPRLYMDCGEGYSEDTAIALPEWKEGRLRRILLLPPRPRTLRLDPACVPMEFSLSLEVYSLGKGRLFLMLLLQALRMAGGVRRKARLLASLPSEYRHSRFNHFAEGQIRVFNEREAPHRGAAPGFQCPAPRPVYDAWLEVNRWNERSEASLRERLKRCQGNLPRISVITPVFNPPPAFLDRAITSVVNQVYTNWELCLADDGSSNPEVVAMLRHWADQEPRIRVQFRSENGGISAASNTAAELASGEYLAFLDHDDELAPDALAEVALYIAGHPDTDMLYSDEDKVSENSRYDPWFKPDWSPELLLSYMYCGHLLVVRRSLFEAVGRFRSSMDGSQDHDLALRLSERVRHAGHIPQVLYHWRAVPGSTACSGHAKPKSLAAGRRAVQEAFSRRGYAGTVRQPEWAAREGYALYQHEFPDDGPLVSILIPTKNGLPVLRACIASLARTTYRNYEVVIIDTGSDDPAVLRYLESGPHDVLRIASPDQGFSFAYVNNRAAEQVAGEYLLFLNNDTEVIEPRWLSHMMGYARMEGVGVVGARLLFPDGRVQHAGVLTDQAHGLPAHAFKLMPRPERGYMFSAAVARNYSAVTAACMLTPRQLFLDAGGFDEENFPVTYNDVDYCLRLIDRAFRCVYCPGAELLHHENYSRSGQLRAEECAAFRRRHRNRRDPFYNPHLSPTSGMFEIQPRRLANHLGRPVRVALFSHNLNIEGAPYHLFELAIALKKRGWADPIVFSPQDGLLRSEYESQGIPVRLCDHLLAGVNTTDRYDRVLTAFASAWQEDGAEVIFANTLQTFYAVGAATRLGLPSVWNIHESEPWQTYFDFLPPAIARKALEYFRDPYRVIFVADATRDAWSPLNSAHNFTVIHNGVDLQQIRTQAGAWTRASARRLLDIGEEEVVVLALGTVCPRKGQHDLVHALRRLPPEVLARLRCFIVGDRPGDYSAQLSALVHNSEIELQKRIRVVAQEVVPEPKDVVPYYHAADVFVCTSRVESFPRVILEAMAYGLPIISTSVFGIREQIFENENGLFYEPGDVERLAELVEKLVLSRAERERLAGAGRHVLDMLPTVEEMADGYGQILLEAYQSKGREVAACRQRLEEVRTS